MSLLPLPNEVAEFLGPKGCAVVVEVADPSLQGRIVEALQSCIGTLKSVDGIDLSPQELADLETPNVAAWEALAPEVRNVLVAVRRTADSLGRLFPADSAVQQADSDFSFADFGAVEHSVDEIVRGANSDGKESISEGVRMLANVLEQEIIGLGQKLRNPAVVGDRWFLLAELHQFLNQCAQCLEAVVATILNALTPEALDEVLPRYVDATNRAARLRMLVTDLCWDMDQLNVAIAHASDDELSILAQGIAARLNAFSSTVGYKSLSPSDKRAIILFRIFLNGWEKKGSDAAMMRNEVEGFCKFLALMRQLNWNESLAEHDRNRLSTIRGALASGTALPGVISSLMTVYGRSDPLDDRIRAIRLGIPAKVDELIRMLSEAEGRLPPR